MQPQNKMIGSKKLSYKWLRKTVIDKSRRTCYSNANNTRKATTERVVPHESSRENGTGWKPFMRTKNENHS